MRRLALAPIASLLVLGALCACGGSEATLTCSTVTTQSGSYTIKACGTVPPARGDNTFTYQVTDKSGAPVDGLTLSVQPWMPDMGHGSPGTPTVAANGGGAYQISNVVFTMPGVWQLRTAISAPATDSANPQFNID